MLLVSFKVEIGDFRRWESILESGLNIIAKINFTHKSKSNSYTLILIDSRITLRPKNIYV